MKPKCCVNSRAIKDTGKIASLLKIIAEENRLKILCVLKSGEHCVCQLIDHLGLPQSLLSHHLKGLKEVGLIKSSKRGLWVYYSLTDKGRKIANLDFK